MNQSEHGAEGMSGRVKGVLSTLNPTAQHFSTLCWTVEDLIQICEPAAVTASTVMVHYNGWTQKWSCRKSSVLMQSVFSRDGDDEEQPGSVMYTHLEELQYLIETLEVKDHVLHAVFASLAERLKLFQGLNVHATTAKHCGSLITSSFRFWVSISVLCASCSKL